MFRFYYVILISVPFIIYYLLKAEGGYIMYSNHQGKYDAIGIISAHEKPCTVVMDEERSKVIITNQFVELLDGVRLSRTDY